MMMVFQVTAFNVTGLQPDTKYKVQVSNFLDQHLFAKARWVTKVFLLPFFAPKLFQGLVMMMVGC